MNNTELIENDKGDIRLVRLILNDRYSETWIEFNGLKDPDYPDQYINWDNDDFIFGKFYKFLKRLKKGELKKKDRENFNDVWIILTDDTVRELIEMIQFALEKEWYKPKEEKEVKNKKSNSEI